jgi:hypothetical protein
MTFRDNSWTNRNKQNARICLAATRNVFGQYHVDTPKMAEYSELRSSGILTFLFLYYACVYLNAVSKLLLTQVTNEVPS